MDFEYEGGLMHSNQRTVPVPLQKRRTVPAYRTS